MTTTDSIVAYTVPELAGILRCSVRTVRDRLRDGRLPHARIGRRYIVTREQLQQFLDAGGSR